MNNKDNINPNHYKSHPSGVECIDITRHMTFNIGNVIKYCWRAGLKEDTSMNLELKHLEDLKKAQWYLNDEIKKLEKELLVPADYTQDGGGWRTKKVVKAEVCEDTYGKEGDMVFKVQPLV
jgi:hypothetical protein